MTPERWQRVKEVFQSVMEREPEEREGLLAAFCADDPDLRAEVESLIDAHNRPWDLIESPAFESTAFSLGEPTRLTDGQTLDHYRLIALLGAGGMGEVYLAVDTRLDRQAAVKLLPPGFTHNPDRLRRFIQEAKAASALNHPNIVTIYDIGRTGETYYIGAEFIDGETLRRRMGGGRMEPRAAIDIAQQVAGALAAAHDAGIVHRDIKPENVMLRRDGYVKVLDFGLAKLVPPGAAAPGNASGEIKPLTKSGTIMGTVGYMSPEQARGLKVDARTDIFSLGVVLYEMLAGSPPFTGETTTDVLVAILEREPEPLARHAPDAPAELQRIVGRMLAKRCEDRYQSSRDRLLDLQNLKRDLDLDEHRSSGASRSRGSADRAVGARLRPLMSWVERRRGTALALAALVIAVLVAVLYFSMRESGKPAIGSIAVLPFDNIGGDPEMEFLSDGITESLINSLSQISRLRVMARATVFTYKDRQIDLRKIGRDLNVDAVLTGKVTQRGETLTIQTDLVHVADGSQLWGDRYQRRVSEVIALQESIAREISERLRLRLSGAEQQRLTKRYTDNPDAYRLYIKGRHHNTKRTQEDLQKALEYFQQAIDLDANYAQAYAGMADTYGLIGIFSFARPTDVRLKAEAAASKALELDPDLVEALGARVYLNTWANNWEAVERDARRAIDLNTNYPGVRYDYGVYLSMMGRHDEAKQQFVRAQVLDPLSAVRSYGVARQLYWQHQYDEAIREFQQALGLDQQHWPAHFFLAFCYLNKGEINRALAEGTESARLSGNHQAAVGALGMVYAVAGRRTEAQALLDGLLQQSKQSYVSGYYIAQIYNALGNADQAFVWLEKLYEEGYGLLPFVKVDPNWDNLRGDPRYASLMRRIGLTP